MQGLKYKAAWQHDTRAEISLPLSIFTPPAHVRYAACEAVHWIRRPDILGKINEFRPKTDKLCDWFSPNYKPDAYLVKKPLKNISFQKTDADRLEKPMNMPCHSTEPKRLAFNPIPEKHQKRQRSDANIAAARKVLFAALVKSNEGKVKQASLYENRVYNSVWEVTWGN
jgi:hypothetical protein